MQINKEMAVVDTTDPDLREAVLAENVQIRKDPQDDAAVEVMFDFLCPNCGKRHWATEFDSDPVFSTVGWLLKCGRVTVRMPWAQTPKPDTKSVYGVAKIGPPKNKEKPMLVESKRLTKEDLLDKLVELTGLGVTEIINGNRLEMCGSIQPTRFVQWLRAQNYPSYHITDEVINHILRFYKNITPLCRGVLQNYLDYQCYSFDEPSEKPTRHVRTVGGTQINTLRTAFPNCCVLEVEAGTTGKRGGDSGHGGRTYIHLKDLASCDLAATVNPPGEGPNGKTITIIAGGDAELEVLKQALSSALSFIEQTEREAKETPALQRWIELTDFLENYFTDYPWDKIDRGTVSRFANSPQFNVSHFAQWLKAWNGWRSVCIGGIFLLLESYDDFYPLVPLTTNEPAPTAERDLTF
jgi:hypothetical protein